MSTSMTSDQRKAYMKFVARWNNCTHFGIIISRVDRINDVRDRLVRLGLTNLIPYLLINEKTNAFIYEADLGRKNPIQIVEIYHNMRPRATEWRELYAEIALWLDDDLVDALDYGVAVTDSVVPFAGTAQKEAILNNW